MELGIKFKDSIEDDMTEIVYSYDAVYNKVINKLFYIDLFDDELYLYIEPDINTVIKYKIFDKNMNFIDYGKEKNVGVLFDRLLLDRDKEILVGTTHVEFSKMLLISWGKI